MKLCVSSPRAVDDAFVAVIYFCFLELAAFNNKALPKSSTH